MTEVGVDLTFANWFSLVLPNSSRVIGRLVSQTKIFIEKAHLWGEQMSAVFPE